MYSFNDILRKSVLNSFDSGKMSYADAAVNFAAAIICGVIIFVIYRKFFRGVVYNLPYNVSLVLMTVLTCMIIIAISSNIVLSLGMVGALSIIRYRTAIKEAMDLMYMFWAVACGITCGAGLYPLALMGSAAVIICLLILGLLKVRDKAYVLIVRYPPELDDKVRITLAQLKFEVKSKSSSKNMVELTVELRLKGDNHQIVHKLTEIEGVEHAVLVQYNGDYAN